MPRLKILSVRRKEYGILYVRVGKVNLITDFTLGCWQFWHILVSIKNDSTKYAPHDQVSKYS